MPDQYAVAHVIADVEKLHVTPDAVRYCVRHMAALLELPLRLLSVLAQKIFSAAWIQH